MDKILTSKQLAIGALALIGLLVFASNVAERSHTSTSVSYPQLLDAIHAGQVSRIIIETPGVPAVCHLKDGKTVRAILPAGDNQVLLAARDKLVNIDIEPPSSESGLLLKSTPFLALLGLWTLLLAFRLTVRSGR